MHLHHVTDVIAETPITNGTIVHLRKRAPRNAKNTSYNGAETSPWPDCQPRPDNWRRDPYPVGMSAARAMHLGAIFCPDCAAQPDIHDTPIAKATT